MKKAKIFGIFAVVLLLTGCKDSFTNKKTEGETGYIKIGHVNASRTALPDFNTDSITDFEFTLKGTKSGDTEKTIGTFSSLEELLTESIAIEIGTYNFTLTASKSGTILTGSIEDKEITTGDNTITFNLKWDETSLDPDSFGDLEFTINLSTTKNANNLKSIFAELLSYDPDTETATTISDDYKQDVIPSSGKAVFTLSNVPAGNYLIRAYCYADNYGEVPLIYPLEEIAVITGGQTSKETISPIAFDDVYTISFNNLNGTYLSNKQYTQHTEEITLQALTKSGWNFGGWYDNPNCNGTPITTIPKGSSGNIALYALWSQATISVSIEPIADLSLTALPNEEDNTVTFTVTGGKEGSTYDWYVDGVAAEASGDTFVLEPNAIGTKTYVVEVISGTRSATATAEITATKVKSRSSIVLYDLDVSNSKREFESPTPGFYVYSDFDSIKTTSLEDAKLQDITNANDNFAIDPVTQTIYTLSGSSIYKHTNFAGKNTEKIISGIDYTVQSICAYDSNVYLLKNAGDTDNALIRISGDGTAVTLAYGNTSGNILDHSMSYKSSRIEVYKNNLYFVSIGYDDNDDNFEYKLRISQIPINGNELGTSNTITTNNFNNTSVSIYSLNITDIQAIDGKDSSVNLYILCNSKNIQRYESSSYLRGGIITVNVKNDSLAFTNFDGTALENSGKPNIFGWYDDSLDKAIAVTEYTKSYFYGPSRFVARKPDELIIVDEGNYYIDSEGKLFEKDPDGSQILVNKNSIVTVSLIDFAITDRTDIDLGFEINLNPGFNHYTVNGYAAESYRNTSYQF